MYHDASADMAYDSARNSFESHRDKILNEAQAAHEAGDEDRAEDLLIEANKLVYTGLQWQLDNGLMDDLYAYPEGFQAEIDPEYRKHQEG